MNIHNHSFNGFRQKFTKYYFVLNDIKIQQISHICFKMKGNNCVCFYYFCKKTACSFPMAIGTSRQKLQTFNLSGVWK